MKREINEMQKTIKELRETIDGLDIQITEAFEKRLEAVREIGKIKKAENAPVCDNKREDEILQRLGKSVKPENRAAAEALYRAVFEISKDEQQKNVQTVNNDGK